MKEAKVVLVGPTPPLRGGIAHFTALLSNALEKKVEVELLSFQRLYPSFLYPGESEVEPESGFLQVKSYRLIDTLNPISWMKAILWINKLKPRLVIMSWWTTFLVPCYWLILVGLRFLKIRTAILVHNVVPHDASWWDRWLSWFVLRLADSFLVQNESQAEVLQDLLKNPINVAIAQHPLYQQFKASDVDRSVARHRIGLDDEASVLLFFGFVRPYKGLEDLLQAFAMVAKSWGQVTLLIAGEFWESRVKYENIISELGIQGDVLLFDKYIADKDVAGYFAASDLFVAPYRAGTQSGSLKIALAFGLPAVITEPISDGRLLELPLVTVVPPKSPRSLAAAIDEHLRNPPPETALRNSSTESGDGWGVLAETLLSLMSSSDTSGN